MGRVDKRTIEARIEAARLLLLGGNESATIARDLSQRWDVSVRQAERYVSQAEDRIRGVLAVDKAFRTAEAFAARRELRQRALKAGDDRLVLEILKDEAKLQGLYAPERAEVANTMKTEPTVTIYIPDNQRGDGPDHADD